MTEVCTGPEWGQRGKHGKNHDLVWDCLHCQRSKKRSKKVRDIVLHTVRGPKKHILINNETTACGFRITRYKEMKAYEEVCK